MTMKIKIHNLEEGSTSVDVDFTLGDIIHTRKVNAVFTDGTYDVDKTEERVNEVSRGVKIKIESGIIKNPEELAEVDDTPEPSEVLNDKEE